MSRIPYDNYNEKGVFIKKNIELDKQYAEPQQMNTKIEDASQAGEVMLAMDSLANVISAALMVVDNLKARLHPILPPESKDEGINYISKSEFSCPLAKELEHDYCRISKITEVIQYLLKNIKL